MWTGSEVVFKKKRKKGRRWSEKKDAPLREIWEQLHQSWHDRRTIEGAVAASFWWVMVHVWRRYRGEGKKWGYDFFENWRNRSIFKREEGGCHFLEFEELVHVLKRHFWGCCLEEINPCFREEVRLSFLRIWGNQSRFQRDSGCCLRWSVQVFERAFWGCDYYSRSAIS